MSEQWKLTIWAFWVFIRRTTTGIIWKQHACNSLRRYFRLCVRRWFKLTWNNCIALCLCNNVCNTSPLFVELGPSVNLHIFPLTSGGLWCPSIALSTFGFWIWWEYQRPKSARGTPKGHWQESYFFFSEWLHCSWVLDPKAYKKLFAILMCL